MNEPKWSVLGAREGKVIPHSKGGTLLSVDPAVPEISDRTLLEEMEAAIESGEIVVHKETNWMGFTHALIRTKDGKKTPYFARLSKPKAEAEEAPPPMRVRDQLKLLAKSPPNKLADPGERRDKKFSPAFTEAQHQRVQAAARRAGRDTNGWLHALIMHEVEADEVEAAEEEGAEEEVTE